MYSKEEIITLFARYANEHIALGQKAYMKDRFEFFGIKAPERRSIQRPLLQKDNLPERREAYILIRQLWGEPHRELHYFAMELLAKYQKQFEKDDIQLLEYLITQKSWWDTVDFLAANLVGIYIKNFPEERDELIGDWLNSGNLWLQRTCLLYQLKYKADLDTQKLVELIERLEGSSEFFINKAIGWILREYSKTNPVWVIDFVDKTPLHSLSKREALKVVNRQ